MLSDSIYGQLRTALDFFNATLEQQNIQGFLPDIQGYALMMLAELGPGVGAIVEIGSFKGKSTTWLAKGSKRARREMVYAVDHFAGSPEHQKGMPIEDADVAATGSTFDAFQRNIASVGVSDYVVPIISNSEDAARAWSKPIRLLFIDADHTYEASKLDFDCWSPHVVSGGLIAFHDIDQWPGVTQFYRTEVLTNPQYKEIMRVDAIAVIEKV